MGKNRTDFKQKYAHVTTVRKVNSDHKKKRIHMLSLVLAHSHLGEDGSDEAEDFCRPGLQALLLTPHLNPNDLDDMVHWALDVLLWRHGQALLQYLLQ